MRKRSLLRALLMPSCLACVSGCTPEARKEIDREVTRWVYTERIGPIHAAVVVGAAFPAGGPSGLSAVVTDFGLRAAFAQHTGSDLPPSPWEVPDPIRPVQIGPSQQNASRPLLHSRLAQP